MKKALEFHLADESTPPVAKGLEYHLQHGILKEEPLAPRDFVSEITL
jgi:hypothetical protein